MIPNDNLEFVARTKLILFDKTASGATQGYRRWCPAAAGEDSNLQPDRYEQISLAGKTRQPPQTDGMLNH